MLFYFGEIFYTVFIPLWFRKAGRVWSGGAREAHWAKCHNRVLAKPRSFQVSPLFFILMLVITTFELPFDSLKYIGIWVSFLTCRLFCTVLASKNNQFSLFYWEQKKTAIKSTVKLSFNLSIREFPISCDFKKTKN